MTIVPDDVPDSRREQVGVIVLFAVVCLILAVVGAALLLSSAAQGD